MYVECVVGHSVCDCLVDVFPVSLMVEHDGLWRQFVYFWGVGKFTNNCVVVESQIFPHPEVPEMRDYGWRDNMRSSMSLSFVESHVWVGVLSFVSVMSMSTMISCSRVPPEVRVLFLVFAVKVACKYDVVPPQTEPLNDFS